MLRQPLTLKNVTAGETEAASQAIPFGDRSGGMFFVPAGSSITQVTWYAAFEEGGVFLPASGYENTLVAVAAVQTVAHTNAYQIPPCLAGARLLKAVADHAGVIDLCLKG